MNEADKNAAGNGAAAEEARGEDALAKAVATPIGPDEYAQKMADVEVALAQALLVRQRLSSSLSELQYRIGKVDESIAAIKFDASVLSARRVHTRDEAK